VLDNKGKKTIDVLRTLWYPIVWAVSRSIDKTLIEIKVLMDKNMKLSETKQQFLERCNNLALDIFDTRYNSLNQNQKSDIRQLAYPTDNPIAWFELFDRISEKS